MEQVTLFPLDGPRAYRPREVIRRGSTMDDMKMEDGTYVFYDRSRGYVDVVGVKKTGVFVGSESGLMFAATECWREKYDGVL